jgi:cyclopropane-fatty-acyl-phospholipid synthase
MLHLEDITQRYPETLRRWGEKFAQSGDRAAQMGFDQRFRRLWELYFAWCEGGFRERRITAVQALLAKPSYRGSSLPLSRSRVLTGT